MDQFQSTSQFHLQWKLNPVLQFFGNFAHVWLQCLSKPWGDFYQISFVMLCLFRIVISYQCASNWYTKRPNSKSLTPKRASYVHINRNWEQFPFDNMQQEVFGCVWMTFMSCLWDIKLQLYFTGPWVLPRRYCLNSRSWTTVHFFVRFLV